MVGHSLQTEQFPAFSVKMYTWHTIAVAIDTNLFCIQSGLLLPKPMPDEMTNNLPPRPYHSATLLRGNMAACVPRF